MITVVFLGWFAFDAVRVEQSDAVLARTKPSVCVGQILSENPLQLIAFFVLSVLVIFRVIVGYVFAHELEHGGWRHYLYVTGIFIGLGKCAVALVCRGVVT